MVGGDKGGAFQVEGGGRTINPGGRQGPPDVARLAGEGGRQCQWEAQSLRSVQGMMYSAYRLNKQGDNIKP